MNLFGKKASVPQKEDSNIRRSYLSKELVTSPADGVDTVADVLPWMVKKYGNKVACYNRRVLKIVEEKKTVPKKGGAEGETEEKLWKFFTMSEPQPHTYNELNESVRRTASGMRHLGLGRDGWRDEDGKERVGVYAETSMNWQIMSHSLARMGHPLTTAYTTLGPEGLQHSLHEPSVRLVFTNASLLGTLLKVIDECPTLIWVVYDREEDADQSIVDKISEKLSQRRAGEGENAITGRILGMQELQDLGKENMVGDSIWKQERPKRDDLFCIMYTSGSTGAPKGVLLTHHNIICSLAGTKKLLQPEFRPDDVFLAFLPLAHILELLVEMTFYFTGVPVAYGTVKTLTQESVRNCDGDMVAYKPSIIVGVPAVYELIRKGIVKKIHESPAVVQSVFNLAYHLKKTVPMTGAVLDKVVFAKAKAATGGRVRLMMNGGAALSRTTQEFLNTTLATALQGYGATETCGMCCVLTPGFFQYSTVGCIVPSLEVKLHDYPEAGYLSSNNPPQGEIWLRGGSVTRGYYKRPDVTKESFTDDGWFRTGDIGQWEANGTLAIVDRIKNLVKLRSGEYLALEKLESSYGSCDVAQNTMVYADSDADRPIAIVVPHEGNLHNHLKAAGINVEGDLEQLAKNKQVKEYLLKELRSTGQKAGLKGPEILQDIIVSGELWTPEGGQLTAANKIQRKVIVKQFEKEIKETYGKS